MSTSKLFSALAVAALAGFCVQALAADRTSPVNGGATQPLGVIKLRNTAVETGSGGALQAGYNAIGTGASLICPSAAPNGCTITVSEMVQTNSLDGYWAICPAVNSNSMNPGCPYQGFVASGGPTYVTGNGQSSYTVPAGSNNFVQVRVYVDYAATLGSWQATYHIYKN